MRGNRTLWRSLLTVIFAGVLVGVDLAAAAPRRSSAAARRVAQLRARQAQIDRRIREQRQEVQRTLHEKNRIAQLFWESEARLEAAQSALENAERELAAARARVEAATRRLQLAEERLRQARRAFGRRLNEVHMEGPVTYLDVVLGARSLDDYLDRQYVMERVLDRDARLLRQLRALYQEVQADRRALLAEQQRAAAAHAEWQRRVAQVQQQYREREQLLERVKQDLELEQSRLEALEEDSYEIQRMLERILAERSSPAQQRRLPSWSGRWAWPVPGGRRGSGFGMRYHPILRQYRMHTGIDIAAPHGTPIYAAAAGEVIYAARRGGYGNCIIVLHGGGYATLYAHLSRFAVRVGEDVRRGQLIGYVGSTGLSTGPHLHFEVRRNGQPINPLR